MRRDLDLIRRILITIEESERGYGNISVLAKKMGEDFNKVCFHIQLLVENGYMNGEATYFSGNPQVIYYMHGITFAGYDYLDSIRNDTIWERTKEKLQTFGSAASLEVVRATAEIFLR